MLEGMRRAGYKVAQGEGNPADERDVLLTWTRHRGWKQDACDRFEKRGGTVVVAEEGYIRRLHGEHWIALSLDEHNGAGRTPHGGPERWAERFRLPLSPWRAPGRRVLVREQRGIGSRITASPEGFHQVYVKKAQAYTKRKVEVRKHHKNEKNQVPLSQMDDVHAVVTWMSAIAVEALLAGIPVFLMGPHSIVEEACHRDLVDLDAPKEFDRLPALEKMAWGQWSLAEVRTGEPYKRLMELV